MNREGKRKERGRGKRGRRRTREKERGKRKHEKGKKRERGKRGVREYTGTQNAANMLFGHAHHNHRSTER